MSAATLRDLEAFWWQRFLACFTDRRPIRDAPERPGIGGWRAYCRQAWESLKRWL